MNQLVEQRSGFDLQVNNIDEAMRLATMIANSQLAPKGFAGKSEDVFVAMMLGNEVGLNPIQSVQNIAVVNGRPSIWGDAMLALVQNHPMFIDIEEHFDESKMEAICIVSRKGSKKSHSVKYTQTDAQKANLWGKAGPWQTSPKRMLQMRARGFALRDKFADALLGLITREEALDYPADVSYTIESITHDTDTASEPVQTHYAQENFDKAFDTFASKIKSGAKTADELIEFIASKGTPFTDTQIATLRAIKVGE